MGLLSTFTTFITICEAISVFSVEIGRKHIEQSSAPYENLKAMNPNYNFKFFDDSNTSDYMEKNCPYAFSAFDNIIPYAFKVDIFRLCLMYVEGGIYLDYKSTTLIPFDEWLMNDHVMVTQSYGKSSGLINGFLYSPKPGHEIFKNAMDLVMDRHIHRSYGINTYDVTGPFILNRAVNRYLGNQEESLLPKGYHKDIYIGSEENTHGSCCDNIVIRMIDKDVIRVRHPGYSRTKALDSGRDYSVLYSQRKIFK